MFLKILKQNLLLFAFLLTIPLHSMKNSIEKHQTKEQIISPIETMPNEVLLQIFQYKIQSIINTHDAVQAKEEFKIFLGALRVTNKKFYQFTDELKNYFFSNKKIEKSSTPLNSPRELPWVKSGDESPSTITEMLKPNWGSQ